MDAKAAMAQNRPQYASATKPPINGVRYRAPTKLDTMFAALGLLRCIFLVKYVTRFRCKPNEPIRSQISVAAQPPTKSVLERESTPGLPVTQGRAYDDRRTEDERGSFPAACFPSISNVALPIHRSISGELLADNTRCCHSLIFARTLLSPRKFANQAVSLPKQKVAQIAANRYVQSRVPWETDNSIGFKELTMAVSKESSVLSSTYPACPFPAQPKKRIQTPNHPTSRKSLNSAS